MVGSNIKLPVVFSEWTESAGPVIAAGFDDQMAWLCIDIGGGPRGSTEAAFLVYDRAGWLISTWDTRLRNDEGEVADSIQEIRRPPSGDLFGLQCTIPTATGTGIDLLDFFIFAMPSREAGRWVAPSIAFSGNQRGNCSGSLYSDPLLGGPLDEFEGYEEIQIDHRIAFAEEQILLHRRGFMRRVLHSEGDGPPAEAHHVSEVLKWDPVARRFVAYL